MPNVTKFLNILVEFGSPTSNDEWKAKIELQLKNLEEVHLKGKGSFESGKSIQG